MKTSRLLVAHRMRRKHLFSILFVTLCAEACGKTNFASAPKRNIKAELDGSPKGTSNGADVSGAPNTSDGNNRNSDTAPRHTSSSSEPTVLTGDETDDSASSKTAPPSPTPVFTKNAERNSDTNTVDQTATETSVNTSSATGSYTDTDTGTSTAVVAGPTARILSGLTPYQFNGIKYPMSKSSLNILVSENGDNSSGKLSHYLYSLAKGKLGCSTSLVDYREKQIAEGITDQLTELGDHTLCILGKNSQGHVQSFPATQYQFYRFQSRTKTAIAPIQSGVGTLSGELWTGKCEVPSNGTPTQSQPSYLKKYTIRCATPPDLDAPTQGASGKLVWTMRPSTSPNGLLPETKQLYDVTLVQVDADDRVTAKNISGLQIFADVINEPFTSNAAAITQLFVSSTLPEVKFETTIEDVYAGKIHVNFDFVVTYFEEP